jgi:hypothetical protein
MSDFMKASRLKLKFPTTKGLLSLDQLWDLSLGDLDELAVGLAKSYDDSKGKSYLSKKSTKDKTIKLQFDIVLAVLNTLVEEKETAMAQSGVKAHNQKILSLIQEKKEASLKELDIKSLEKLLK